MVQYSSSSDEDDEVFISKTKSSKRAPTRDSRNGKRPKIKLCLTSSSSSSTSSTKIEKQEATSNIQTAPAPAASETNQPVCVGTK